MIHKECLICHKIGHKPEMDRVLIEGYDSTYTRYVHKECTSSLVRRVDKHHWERKGN